MRNTYAKYKIRKNKKTEENTLIVSVGIYNPYELILEPKYGFDPIDTEKVENVALFYSRMDPLLSLCRKYQNVPEAKPYSYPWNPGVIDGTVELLVDLIKAKRLSRRMALQVTELVQREIHESSTIFDERYFNRS